MPSLRNVILFIATSLDGYIAKPGDDLSFLSAVQKEGEDYGYGDFIATVDTVIMGRKTYDWVTTHVPEFPHAEKETYVLTRTPMPPAGNIHFFGGNLQSLVTGLRNKPGKNIFIDGGADVVNELLKGALIDEFYIAIIPVLLGEGVRLFRDGRPEQTLELLELKPFETGLVLLHYKNKIT
jgi:dihydrofolate reductase